MVIIQSQVSVITYRYSITSQCFYLSLETCMLKVRSSSRVSCSSCKRWGDPRVCEAVVVGNSFVSPFSVSSVSLGS